MHQIVDLLRQIAADTRHARQVIDTGPRHTLQSAEVLHQALAPSRSDTRDLRQR